VEDVGAWISGFYSAGIFRKKSCSWRQIDVTGMKEQVEMFVAKFICIAVTVMLVTGETRAMHCKTVALCVPSVLL